MKTVLSAVCAFALVSILPALGQEAGSAQEAEIERLNQQVKTETDPQKVSEIYKRISELYTEAALQRMKRLHEEWIAETDPAKKKATGEELARAAVHAGRPDVVAEVSTNGTYGKRQLAVPAEAQKLTLKTVATLQSPDTGLSTPWVIRRMTRDRFEAWKPTGGWLFNGAGKLLNQAHPKRRDGHGREWYGAFLPDGRWVTTDIWEMDRTLTFFSRDGKWVKEISSDKIVPPAKVEDADDHYPLLIGWCRCDRDGKGFVVSVGANGGLAVGWVTPDGPQRVLKESNEPWRLCYPRDLEPKGMYVSRFIPSDDRKQLLVRDEPGHGPFVGFPSYSMNDLEAMVPNGEGFGFWPNSSEVYILANPMADDAKTDGENSLPMQNTWFYRGDGTFTGWIAAQRIADASSKNGAMLFYQGDGRIVDLTKDLKVEKVVRLVWPDGSAAIPEKIFPDLHLGFFRKENDLILARWPGEL